jgi:hypothetical protein
MDEKMIEISEFVFIWGLMICSDVLGVHINAECHTNPRGYTMSERVLRYTGFFPILIVFTQHIIQVNESDGNIFMSCPSKISVHVLVKNRLEFIQILACSYQ